MNSVTKSLHWSVLLGSCFLLASSDLRAADATATNEPEAIPVPASPAPSAPAPSVLLGSGPCACIPHAGNGFMNTEVIIGDQMVFDSTATEEANRPYQHPAPEVVLTFSRGCTDAAPANWSLSSRDTPKSRPAIPHGPLLIKVRMDVEPVAFVELMLDGKALKPIDYASASPLNYELPCPLVGQHVLQARYLSGNLWSYYSNALRFEVRLPNQPRIIAVADFDRDPTPLTRNGLTSITTHSIKIHLANVARGDSIVAYVDGKPVSSQSDREPCCRIIKVEGLVTPGVHKLAVRTVGCPGSCSITSQPSNEIAFHYYDEDVYLLKPGAGCGNKRPNACLPPLNSTSDVRRTTRPAVQDESAFHFVSFFQASPAGNAKQYSNDAGLFSQQADQSYVAAANHAAAAAAQASAAADIAQTAQRESVAAAADVQRAKAVADDATKIHGLVSKMLQRPESTAAIDAAKLAAAAADQAALNAESALRQAEVHVQLAAKHAQVASRYAAAATKPRDLAKTVRDQAVRFATDAQTHAASAARLEANNLVVEANNAEQQAAVERNGAAAASQRAESLEQEAAKFDKFATDFKDLADRALADARREFADVKKGLQQVVDARSRAQASHHLAAARDIDANGRDAATAYTATKDILDANSASVGNAAQNVVNRSQASVQDALAAVALAKSHDQRAYEFLKDAALALKQTQDSADQADRESARASVYADLEATCGDEARARVARDRSNVAAHHAQLTSDQLALAEQNYEYVEAARSDARTAVHDVQAQLASAQSFRDLAQQELDQLVAARAEIAQAESKAKDAYNREATLRNGRDFVGARQALTDVLAAKAMAESSSQDVQTHDKQTQQYAVWATDRERDARAAAQRAEKAAERAHAFTAVVKEATTRAAQLAATAASSAQLAGRVLEKDADAGRAWDAAEEKAAYDAAVDRFNAATSTDTDAHGVKRAEVSSKAAQTRATQEWQKAVSRIAEGQAHVEAARAKSVVGPSSPFIFASAAHFPIREFGLRGESLDREGLLIYEDMALHFDRDGNYEVHFRASAPEMPTTIRLQFQIQPCPGRPWYTITLAPIDFKYPPAKNEKATSLSSSCGDKGSNCRDDKGCCGEVRSCVCKGHSEILRRCYAEMGQDAKIRRTGTARFGFGVTTP